MVEGTAEYSEPGAEPYRIYIGETTIKNMNPSFQGKPVYVDHVDEVDLDNLQAQADGYVIESFYNKADGKNWVKFIVVSDRGKEAIRMGWKLSNAYVPTSFSGGGENHGVSYAKEVTGGEYEHLAIVRNPRYEESMILTPEEFKLYNGEKEIELTRLANSKDKPKENSKMGFNLFKKTKVENSVSIDGLMVELPESKKEMLLTEVITKYDAVHNMNGYANGDHMVKVGENEMSVNDLIKKHVEMCNAEEERVAKENAGEGEPGEDIENDEDEVGTVDEGLGDVDSRGGDHSLDNEEDEVEKDEPKKKPPVDDKKKNATEAKKKAEIKAKNDRIKNAHLRDAAEDTATVELGIDQVARGKARYGSDN